MPPGSPPSPTRPSRKAGTSPGAAQIDPRVVRLTEDGQITDVAVASYLAKYATKSTEPVGVLPAKITPENAAAYADPRTHQGRLIAACLKLGHHSHEDFKALRRWAHMLGYRGHFATKSRRYSTTMRALRAARRDWRRRQHPGAEHQGDRHRHHADRPAMGRARLAHHWRRCSSRCQPQPVLVSTDVSPAKRPPWLFRPERRSST